jgi:hypothetical protein
MLPPAAPVDRRGIKQAAAGELGLFAEISLSKRQLMIVYVFALYATSSCGRRRDFVSSR